MRAPTTYFAHKVALTLFACAFMAFAYLLVSAISHPVQAQDADPSLDILNDSVSSTLDKAETEFDAEVYVLNASDLRADDLDSALKFTVEARTSDKEVVEPSVTIKPRSPDRLDPYSVTPVDLKITLPESWKPFSGYLVVSSQERGSAVDPGTTPLELKQPIARGGDIKYLSWFPPFRSYDWMLLSALALGVLVVLASYISLKSEIPSPSSRLGTSLELDAKSWASVLTLVAALVGAAAGADVFPEERAIFTKQEVAGMSLFFGATLIFAPVVYNLFRRPANVKPDPPEDEGTSITGTFEGSHNLSRGRGEEPDFEGEVDLKQSAAEDNEEITEELVGFVAPYLVAAALILTAVLGQLLLTWLYLAQIVDALPVWARIFLAAAVLVTMVFVILYAVGKIRADCKQRRQEETDEQENRATGQTWIRPQSTLRMP